jgi:hypothetical protein
MTSPAKDNAPTLADYFKLKNMTWKIQFSVVAASFCANVKPIGDNVALLRRWRRHRFGDTVQTQTGSSRALDLHQEL